MGGGRTLFLSLGMRRSGCHRNLKKAVIKAAVKTRVCSASDLIYRTSRAPSPPPLTPDADLQTTVRQSQIYLGTKVSNADLSPHGHGSYRYTFCNSGNLKAQIADGNLCRQRFLMRIYSHGQTILHPRKLINTSRVIVYSERHIRPNSTEHSANG